MEKQALQDHAALLVIDVQKGLFTKSTPVYQAEQLLKNITTLIQKARSQGVPVIFVQHANDKTLVEGGRDWQLHPDIQPVDGELIIHKRHGDAFVDTPLQSELEKMGINLLFVTGLVTHGCVRATSLGAIGAGYRVKLVSDGHSCFSKHAAQLIQKWNQAIQETGAGLIETEAVDFI